MIDKVVVTALVELMGVVTGQLADPLTCTHEQEANAALSSLLLSKGRIDCTTKPGLSSVNHRLAGLLHIRSLSNRLGANERQPAVILEFIPADRMVREMIQTAELVLHKVKTENPVLKLCVIIDFIAFVAAAGQD